MIHREQKISVALCTFLTEKKVAELAGEAAVKATLLENRFYQGDWVNDFEIEGSPGKVTAFLKRVKDVETR